MKKLIIWSVAALAACDTDGSDPDATKARLAALEGRLAAVESALQQAQADVTACKTATERNAALKVPVDDLEPLRAMASFVTVEGSDVIFEGANLHIRNGEGETASANGTGNLIIGYNEERVEPADAEPAPAARSGSHNIVVGPEHGYSSYGGYVGGFSNTVSAEHAAVLSGSFNEAAAARAVVVSGSRNTAEMWSGVVITGQRNSATGIESLVGAGAGNLASGFGAVVVGGRENTNPSDDDVVVEGWELPE